MKQNSRLLKKLNWWVVVGIGFLFVLQLLRIYVGDIDADDFEHLASAWLIFNGYEPYRDFFQHHNPLMWYVIQPFFYWVEKPVEAFMLLRYFVCFCYLICLLSMALIIRRLSGSIWTISYAFLIYMAYPVVSGAYIQGRPDLPMMALLLMGFYFWILFFQTHKRMFLILCYLFFFLSFAFLQKVILFFVPFGMYQLYLLFKKEISWKDVGLALTLPVLATIGYGFYLYQIGMLWRYVELNWILNFHFFRDYKTYHLSFFDWIYHILFCIFFGYGIWKEKRINRQLLIVVLGFSVLFFFIPKPYNYYYMIFAPFMAIVIAFGLEKIKRSHIKIGLILFFLICSGYSFCIRLCFKDTPVVYPFINYFKDFEILNENEWIDYNGLPIFVLCQKKNHQYYWYNQARGALWDIHLFHRHQLQNKNEWIYQTRPALIIGSYVRNLMYASDSVKEPILMQLDKEFLEKYYKTPETGYAVYRLKTSNQTEKEPEKSRIKLIYKSKID